MECDIGATKNNGGTSAISIKSKNYLPGRLGDDTKRLATDERYDPRLRALHSRNSTAAAPVVVEIPTSYDECQAFIADQEKQVKILFEMMSANMEAFDDVAMETTTVDGVDGNVIEVEIRRPVATSKSLLPCILSIHGGGMAMMSSREKVFTYIESRLARMGAIVVNVEFRNSAGELGPHPFPAGLNDCVSVIDWITSNKEKIGYSSFILMGVSGGSNLAIASAMKLKQSKDVIIDGVFVMCPHILDDHDKDKTTLLSVIENYDYGISVPSLAAIATVYTVKPEDATNPLAWTYYATLEDLSGLPPFFISVNELDPLRDEGKTFYINLVEAGVSATCHIVCGTEHAGDIFCSKTCPEIFDATMRNIISFAKSLEHDDKAKHG